MRQFLPEILALAILLISVTGAFPTSSKAEVRNEVLTELESLFESAYFSDYVYNRCGQNMMNFIRSASSQGLSVNSAQLVMIENKGFSEFGMINAELARERGWLDRDAGPSGPRNHPGDANWFHHVVVEFDGHIFDMDFMNTPTVLPVCEYFERMFLDDNPNRGHLIGRKTKLKDYQITLSSNSDPYKPLQIMRLNTYLEKLGCELQNSLEMAR